MNTAFIILFILAMAVVFNFFSLIVFSMSMAEYKQEYERKKRSDLLFDYVNAFVLKMKLNKK